MIYIQLVIGFKEFYNFLVPSTDKLMAMQGVVVFRSCVFIHLPKMLTESKADSHTVASNIIQLKQRPVC